MAKIRRSLQQLDTTDRDATGDLLAAFVMSGWEQFLPVETALEAAEKLAGDDPIKAKKLSGYLMRGEQMSSEIEVWVRSVGLKRLTKIEENSNI